VLQRLELSEQQAGFPLAHRRLAMGLRTTVRRSHHRATPLFSVIVPTFDRFELLKDTLSSVFHQRFGAFEIIVVDDGSKDETVGYLKSLGRRVTALSQPNGGPAAARNLGARHAQGTYLAFLDSDDLWFPWTLEVYAKVLQNAGQPCFLVGKPQRFRTDRALAEVGCDKVQWKHFGDYLASDAYWRWWGVSSFVVKRTTFSEVGGFSAGLLSGEDADLALRMGTATGFVQITAPTTFAYREHAGNIATDLSRNIQAAQYKIQAERRGQYPGGTRRQQQRWCILTRHVRPIALACARSGFSREAWALYWSTFGWHVALRRWRFLGAFPAQALLGLARSKLNISGRALRHPERIVSQIGEQP
jgi:cellulose synthase/poly-beta-1,6-N-acetylglucosamine synthase-like glycosyltransferase